MHPECEQKDNQKGILTQCIFLWNAIYVSLNQLVKSAAKDRRRPVMRERVSQAVSRPTAHKGVSSRTHSSVLLEDLMTPMCAEGSENRWDILHSGDILRGKQMSCFLPHLCGFIILVSLVLVLAGLFLVVKAGVMPVVPSSQSLLGGIISSDLHQGQPYAWPVLTEGAWTSTVVFSCFSLMSQILEWARKMTIQWCTYWFQSKKETNLGDVQPG